MKLKCQWSLHLPQHSSQRRQQRKDCTLKRKKLFYLLSFTSSTPAPKTLVKQIPRKIPCRNRVKDWLKNSEVMSGWPFRLAVNVLGAELVCLNHRVQDIQERWLRAAHVRELHFTQWLNGHRDSCHGSVCNEWHQCSHRRLTAEGLISFPDFLFFHSVCPDGRSSRLEALHNISLNHTVYSVKKGIHMTGFISTVCLSHLQSNGF